MDLGPATAGLFLSAVGLLGVSAPSLAAHGVPAGVVGRHAAATNDIARARRRNDAVISRVQNDIRSTRPKAD